MPAKDIFRSGKKAGKVAQKRCGCAGEARGLLPNIRDRYAVIMALMAQADDLCESVLARTPAAKRVALAVRPLAATRGTTEGSDQLHVIRVRRHRNRHSEGSRRVPLVAPVTCLQVCGNMCEDAVLARRAGCTQGRWTSRTSMENLRVPSNSSAWRREAAVSSRSDLHLPLLQLFTLAT